MVPGRKTDVRDSGGAPRHPRGEVRASRARRCTAARNSGQPAIGPRREDAIERDHRRGRRWPASPNSRARLNGCGPSCGARRPTLPAGPLGDDESA